MHLFNNPWNVGSCLKISDEARAWLDARKAVDAAKERLERAKTQKDIEVGRLVSRLADFSETVPGSYEKFRKAVEAVLAAAKRSEDKAEDSGVGIAEPFEPVDASAVEGFRKAIDPYMSIFDDLDAAERELDFAASRVGEATKAERAAFAAFREEMSLHLSSVRDAFGAVEEIRAASERSKQEARAFMERANAMRAQLGNES